MQEHSGSFFAEPPGQPERLFVVNGHIFPGENQIKVSPHLEFLIPKCHGNHKKNRVVQWTPQCSRRCLETFSFLRVFQQAVFLLNVARGTKKSPPGAANLAGGRFLKRPVFDHGGIHDVGKHDWLMQLESSDCSVYEWYWLMSFGWHSKNRTPNMFIHYVYWNICLQHFAKFLLPTFHMGWNSRNGIWWEFLLGNFCQAFGTNWTIWTATASVGLQVTISRQHGVILLMVQKSS